MGIRLDIGGKLRKLVRFLSDIEERWCWVHEMGEWQHAALLDSTRSIISYFWMCDLAALALALALFGVSMHMRCQEFSRDVVWSYSAFLPV